MRRRTILCLFIFAGLVFMAVQSQADQIIPINLAKINDNTEIAFRGIYEGGKTERKANGVLITNQKFKIIEVIKGEIQGDQEYFEFPQFGAPAAKTQKIGISYRVNFPEFVVGKEYVVFVSAVSPKLKVRDVVGFSQGVFDVVYQPTGKAAVINKFSNKSLFQDLPTTKSVNKALQAGGVDAAKPPEGPMDYDSFKAMIKELK